MTSKRLIIDTNLLISFLITKKLNELDKLFMDKGAKLLLSQELLLELLEVIKRPKFKNFFSEDETAQLTGDKDLLVLEKINKTLILSWSDFL